MINFIEETFSQLKRNMKTLYTTTKKQEILDIVNLRNGEMSFDRRNLVENSLNEAFQIIRSDSIISYINHMISTFSNALEKVDL